MTLCQLPPIKDDISGVCKRTGAEEDELAVFLSEEVMDNALDSIESYASPTSVPDSCNNNQRSLGYL
ncbi:MAG: hypothetical protein WAM14_08410 [Candidatus Nitrosopolaris sp.]